MVDNKKLKEKWKKMSEKEKLEFNGYEGFCKGERRKNNNLFMPKRYRK